MASLDHKKIPIVRLSFKVLLIYRLVKIVILA